MTSLLEKIIGFIAPNRCIMCSNYDNMLCDSCLYNLPSELESCCLLCGIQTGDWQVCKICKAKSAIDVIYTSALYEGVIKDLLHLYKFNYARSASMPLAKIAHGALPYLENDWLIVCVPTVAAHIRARGFDHAKLLAKEIAKLSNLKYDPCVFRLNSSRQVGKTRLQRQQQTKNIFRVSRRAVEDKNVLIVDDVCTTGSTIKEMAKALKKSGAKEVRAVVVAWKK